MAREERAREADVGGAKSVCRGWGGRGFSAVAVDRVAVSVLWRSLSRMRFAVRSPSRDQRTLYVTPASSRSLTTTSRFHPDTFKPDLGEARHNVRVLNYLEIESRLDRSGIGTSTDQQRAALARTDVDVLTSPWQGGTPPAAVRSALSGTEFFRDYDVAHCNLIGPGSLAVARHAKRNDIPLVLHSHVTSEDFAESFRGSNYVAGPLRHYLRWFYSQADLVLCPSEYTKRTLLDYPVDAPIRPISNGVDADSLQGYEQFREETRAEYDLDGLVAFAVGNVFERKGLTDFCTLAERTDYEFVWFGPYDSGPQASKTVRYWLRNHPDNVTFTGWMDDKRAAFGAGDVYLFPAKQENQGIAVLEAMACGKPCILRDIPVFREFYEHEHDCLFCETREEFAAALDRLAENPELRERLGANARQTAAEHSLDRVGERLVSAYEEVTTV
jgi:glycosyltransferase involved in cell wall biosynthesis